MKGEDLVNKKLVISLAAAVLLTAAASLGVSGFSGASIARLAEKKVTVIDPADYGAVADDDEDDGAGLQKALDAAKSKGGTVLLAARMKTGLLPSIWRRAQP